MTLYRCPTCNGNGYIGDLTPDEQYCHTCSDMVPVEPTHRICVRHQSVGVVGFEFCHIGRIFKVTHECAMLDVVTMEGIE